MYGNLKLNRVTHPNVDKMVDVINAGDYKGICDTVGNVLEDVTFAMHPEKPPLAASKPLGPSCSAALSHVVPFHLTTTNSQPSRLPQMHFASLGRRRRRRRERERERKRERERERERERGREEESYS